MMRDNSQYASESDLGTLSIHNLDPEVERTLREEARRSGKSLNQTIKDMLAGATGNSRHDPALEKRRETLGKLCGSLTAEDWIGLDDALGDFERIDPGEWT
jgi:hypothetical protein